MALDVREGRGVSVGFLTYLSRLTHPSGGLFYHLRAIPYRYTIWGSYLNSVEKLWKCFTENAEIETLVLVGPSAGYAWAENFLSFSQQSELKNILVFDPDPLAKVTFEFLHPIPTGVQFQWYKENFFTEESWGRFSWNTKTAVVFCGVLSQLEFSSNPPSDRQLGHLEAKLRDISWLSWHDRFLGSHVTARCSEISFFNQRPGKVPSVMNYDLVSEDVLRTKSREVSVEEWDLESFCFLQIANHYALFSWDFTPTEWHGMEACWSVKTKKGVTTV